MTRKTPRDVASRMERRPAPDAEAEAFTGYGVLGLPFAGGDVLAFRRAGASSIGPAYTSVWYRDHRERWTVFVDVDPRLACPRYLGTALARTVRTGIRLEWTGPRSLSVSVPREQLDWALRIEPSPGTRVWNALGRVLPRPRARNGEGDGLGVLAGRLLGTAPLQLQGEAPNGQWSQIRPIRLWSVSASAAVVAGRDLGTLGAHDPTRLGDLVLPGRPLLMAGDWLYECFDPDRHRHELLGATPAKPAVHSS